MLSNAGPSLASAQRILSAFGEISYYIVNETKSIILPLGLPRDLQTTLQGKFPFPWAKDYISYLGVSLTKSVSSLVKAKFTPFLNTFPKELNRISKTFLPWSGRLATFKILLLPQLLYLFRTLPIPIPLSFFTSIQSTLGKFIWQEGKVRCSRVNLMKHRLAGGMGLPIIKDYYTASLLAQLRTWFTPKSSCPWYEIESLQVPGLSPLLLRHQQWPLLTCSYMPLKGTHPVPFPCQ